MNNTITIVILCTISVFSFSCNKKIIAAKDKTIAELRKNQQEIMAEKIKLPERYYLKNRMENCDDRIKYMQGIIEYAEGKERNKTFLSKKSGSVLGSYVSYVKGESDQSKFKDLKHFYFDLDCFVGQHYSTIFPLLIPPDQNKEVDQFLIDNPNGSHTVEGFIKAQRKNILCFTFHLKNNQIVKATTCTSRTSSGK